MIKLNEYSFFISFLYPKGNKVSNSTDQYIIDFEVTKHNLKY